MSCPEAKEVQSVCHLVEDWLNWVRALFIIVFMQGTTDC